MNLWSITVGATLDRAPTDADARAIARRVGGDTLLSHARQENRFQVQAVADQPDGFPTLVELRDAFARVVGEHGYNVLAWDVLECLSEAEAHRRIEAAAPPELISAADFAALLGVSHQRVYDLASQKKAAVDKGEPHPFPSQYLPGWWLKSAAEHYAANRPGPGRPRKNPPQQ